MGSDHLSCREHIESAFLGQLFHLQKSISHGMVAVNGDDHGRGVVAVHEFHALINRFRNTSAVDRNQEKHDVILIEETGKHGDRHVKDLRVQIVDDQFCNRFRSSGGAEINYVRIHMGPPFLMRSLFRETQFPLLCLLRILYTRQNRSTSIFVKISRPGHHPSVNG